MNKETRKKLSNEIVNLINAEFNLKLKTVESAQMDEFIFNYLGEFKFEDFESASIPLIKFLAENHHPHTKAIIESNCAELLECIPNCNITINDYLVD